MVKKIKYEIHINASKQKVWEKMTESALINNGQMQAGLVLTTKVSGKKGIK